MAAMQIASDELSISARPSEPLLASHLISDEDLDDLVENVCHINLQQKQNAGRSLLETGVKSVDDAIGGGLQSGRLVGLSGEVGAGASEVSTSIADVNEKQGRQVENERAII
jgi:predicted ATP-dependent serine protease